MVIYTGFPKEAEKSSKDIISKKSSVKKNKKNKKNMKKTLDKAKRDVVLYTSCRREGR